jgi:hypothetical protein
MIFADALDILIVDTDKDLNIYKDLVGSQSGGSGSCCGPKDESGVTEPAGKDRRELDFNEWAGESTALILVD